MQNIEWFWLSSRDQAANNWILYKEIPHVILRPRYRDFCCPACGKVDEDAALQSGFDDDVILKSRCDVFRTSEGILCFSERAREFWNSNGIRGLQFLSLPKPNKRNHEVALPTTIAPVNRELSGFQWTPFPSVEQPSTDNEEYFCQKCHRPRDGAYVGPFLSSMTLPDDPMCVATPSISPESLRGKVYWILVSGIVRELLLKERLIGVNLTTPL